MNREHGDDFLRGQGGRKRFGAYLRWCRVRRALLALLFAFPAAVALGIALPRGSAAAVGLAVLFTAAAIGLLRPLGGISEAMRLDRTFRQKGRILAMVELPDEKSPFMDYLLEEVRVFLCSRSLTELKPIGFRPGRWGVWTAGWLALAALVHWGPSIPLGGVASFPHRSAGDSLEIGGAIDGATNDIAAKRPDEAVSGQAPSEGLDQRGREGGEIGRAVASVDPTNLSLHRTELDRGLSRRYAELGAGDDDRDPGLSMRDTASWKDPLLDRQPDAPSKPAAKGRSEGTVSPSSDRGGTKGEAGSYGISSDQENHHGTGRSGDGPSAGTAPGRDAWEGHAPAGTGMVDPDRAGSLMLDRGEEVLRAGEPLVDAPFPQTIEDADPFPTAEPRLGPTASTAASTRTIPLPYRDLVQRYFERLRTERSGGAR